MQIFLFDNNKKQNYFEHQQKLREIRSELTRQHQEHVRDIQRTMERETQVLMDQLRNEYAQHLRAREERHRHEMEEAVLRVNRDLMAAHAEEVGKLQEEHSRQLERILAATPVSASPMSSIIAGEFLNTQLDSSVSFSIDLMH